MSHFKGSAEPADSLTGPAGSHHRRPATGWPLTVGVSVAFVVLAGVLALHRLQGIGQPVTFDLGNYEYYSGFAELHGVASPIALPGQLETYLDAQVNTLYYLLISHLSPRLAVQSIACLQSLSVSLLAILVWRGARAATGSHVVSALAAVLAGAGALYSPLFIETLGETSSDVLLGVLPFAAAALLYQVLTPAGARAPLRNAALAGVLLGLASELKFTETSFSAGIFIAFSVALLVHRPRAQWTYRRCLLLAATVLVPAVVIAVALYLPEGLMLWHRYRDPVFPFLNGVFHSPYLKVGSFNPGYAAQTPASLWFHFTRLFVGAEAAHKKNGLYLEGLRSPVLFFALAIVAGMLVIDLVKRDKPQALFLEISFLVAFLLWAVLYGFYRYLAPLEMAAVAVVVMLLLLHPLNRLLHTAGVFLLAGGLAVGTLYSVTFVVGYQMPFAKTFFALPASPFANLQGDGVLLIGDAPDAFLVPFLPADTELVRAGGNLDSVMSRAWWAHVKDVVQHTHRSRWVMFYGLDTTDGVKVALRRIGFLAEFRACRQVSTALNKVARIQLCHVTPAT